MRGPSCEEVNRFLADYLEGALPDKTHARFRTHIEKCPDCSVFFEQYKTTIEWVREDRDLKIPEDLVEHTLEFLRDNIRLN